MAKAPTAKDPANKPVTFTRKQFEDKVRGKTREEVIAAVGRPDETREKVAGEDLRPAGGALLQYDWWIFRGRVMNDATAKPSQVAVRFNYDGKADRFEYR